MDSAWRVSGTSVQGARHRVHGQRCQDAVAVYTNPAMAVVAAADGHGHPRHARSDEGAAIAVEVLVSLLQSLGSDLLDESNPAHPSTLEKRMQAHLAGRLCWEWNRRVKVHAGLGRDVDGSWPSRMRSQRRLQSRVRLQDWWWFFPDRSRTS